MMHPSVFGIASNTSEALLNESQTFEVYITNMLLAEMFTQL
jgi:hypothetical protein